MCFLVLSVRDKNAALVNITIITISIIMVMMTMLQESLVLSPAPACLSLRSRNLDQMIASFGLRVEKY